MSARKITKEHLINGYLQLKRKIGRRPTFSEFTCENHKIYMRHLVRVFGRPGWSSLMQAAGDKPRKSPVITKEQAIKNYLRLKKELGRKPVSAEYVKQYHGLTSLRKLFGRYGWNSLMRAAGEKTRFAPFVTKAMLIRDYRALKKRLGRRPFQNEYIRECYGAGVIKAKFGKHGWWERLQKAAGVEPLVIANLPAAHLIADFLALQKKLGRRPKLIEYTYQCHTPKVLDRVFGKPGWRKLIDAVGDKAIPRDILTAEHLIDDYNETWRALKRRPTQEQFRKRHRHTSKVYDRVFGRPGFSNLVKAAQSVSAKEKYK